MIQDHSKIVITGASRGLGKKIAEKFWFTGADLAIISRDRYALKKLVDELKPNACRKEQIIEFFICDLSKLETIPKLIYDIKDKFGDPDILINNAGIQGPIGPLQENDFEEWQKCLNINLLAPVLLCREFIPEMINKHYGRIINISGGGATKARPNFTSYATAKCGLVRFTETLAEELKGSGVCANCVAPGAMKSKMTNDVINAGIKKAGKFEYNMASKLLNDNEYDNEYIINRAADLVLLLASDKSDGITGKLISTVWDPWNKLLEHIDELKNSDVYTLRRITPEESYIRQGMFT